MRLFGRKKQDISADAVPDEIKDYYQAEKRDRMWVVWLLSAAVFIITIVAVLGLFWAGRWAVNKISSDDNKTGTTVQEEPKPEEQSTQDTDQGDAQDDANTSGNQDAPQTTPAPSSAPTPSTPSTTTPQTGPTTPELPQTGPSSDE